MKNSTEYINIDIQISRTSTKNLDRFINYIMYYNNNIVIPTNFSVYNIQI